MKRLGERWTEDEIQKVIGLRAKRLSASQIGAAMGRPREAICGLMYRHRARFPLLPAPVPKPKPAPTEPAWKACDVMTATTMWRAGVAIDAIGAAIGKTYYAVFAYSRKHPDLFPARRKPKAETMNVVPMVKAAPADARGRMPPRRADVEPVTFLKVSDRQCKFPLWGMNENPGLHGLCCGASIELGKVYCGFHRAASAPNYQAVAA